MVMYVRVRTLFPCWMVVLLSARAAWVSTTFVIVEIWGGVSGCLSERGGGVVLTYPVSETGDLFDL